MKSECVRGIAGGVEGDTWSDRIIDNRIKDEGSTGMSRCFLVELKGVSGWQHIPGDIDEELPFK